MRACVVVVVLAFASCVPSANSADAGMMMISDAGMIIDAGAGVILDAGGAVIIDAGSPPFSVGAKTHCIAKATARSHARAGGPGNIGFMQGCPSWVDRRVLPPKANGGIGALEHHVTSAQQRSGQDVCCYFGAPPPP